MSGGSPLAGLMNNFNIVVSFLRSVEEGNFSQAARCMGLTPAAVSKHVQQLESELGVRLVHRNTRALALTAVGEMYFQRMSNLYSELRQLEQDVRHHGSEVGGRLRLTLPNGIGRNYFLPVLNEFSQLHQSLKLELHFEDRIVDLVRDGYDAGIGDQLAKDSSFVAKALLPLQRLVFASPAYLTRSGTPQTLADLDGHDCIRVVSQNNGRLMPWEFNDNGVLRRVEVEGRLTVNDPFAACEAALQGAGLAMIGTVQAYPYLATRRLVPLLTDFAPPPRPIYFYYAHRRHLSLPVRLLQDFLMVRMQKSMPPIFGDGYRWPA
ncbi:LysR family transcriptional regulator [Chromobacterium vaccinii]|uniref:LysR family transcriptional regulator n=2 Tax=Chromobacterium vaccinii TaxID=1108595 RepID=A0ABV0FC65_9NEIS